MTALRWRSARLSKRSADRGGSPLIYSSGGFLFCVDGGRSASATRAAISASLTRVSSSASSPRLTVGRAAGTSAITSSAAPRRNAAKQKARPISVATVDPDSGSVDVNFTLHNLPVTLPGIPALLPPQRACHLKFQVNHGGQGIRKRQQRHGCYLPGSVLFRGWHAAPIPYHVPGNDEGVRHPGHSGAPLG